jgi:translation initiation factor IF-3
MIRIREVRLIDETGAQLGIVETGEARRRAYDAGLDLVEVSPDARPPVCKIMDYGKFKYALKKKEHDSKRKQHQVQTKEIRLRPKIAEHDVQYKAKQAREFLLDGDKVQVTMLFRGREMSHMAVAKTVMDTFVAKLADISKVERGAKMEGRRLGLLLLSTAPPKPHDAKKHDDKKHDDKKPEKKDEKTDDVKKGAEDVKSDARPNPAEKEAAPPTGGAAPTEAEKPQT